MEKWLQGFGVYVRDNNGYEEQFDFEYEERKDAFEFALEMERKHDFVEIYDYANDKTIDLGMVQGYLNNLAIYKHESPIALQDNKIQRVEHFTIKCNNIVLVSEYVLGGHIDIFMKWAKNHIAFLEYTLGKQYNFVIYKDNNSYLLKDCNGHLIFVGA
jgi:hypothetical protein